MIDICGLSVLYHSLLLPYMMYCVDTVYGATLMLQILSV